MHDFHKEAETTVPHLNKEQRRIWATHCADTHPGFISTPMQPEKPANLRVQHVFKDFIWLWVWRIAVLAALLAIASKLHAQGPTPALGQHQASAPTLAAGQYQALQLDAGGNLLINCTTGCSSSSGPSFGSVFPSTGVAIGFIGNTGNMTGGTLDSGGNLKVDCASGCSGAADTTASGNLAAANNAVSIAMAGVNSASFTLPSGNNLSAILTPEASADGGTTWTATYLRSANAGFWAATVTVASTAGAYNVLVPGGASNVRIRVSTYTSGAANATVVRGVSQPESVPVVDGIAGSTAPFYIRQIGGTDGTNLRAMSTDSSGRPNVNINGTVPVSGTITANAGTGTFNIQANASTNVAQFGGTNVSTGTGASGTGIPRVTVSNDSNVLATQSGTWTTRAVGNAGAVFDQAPGSATPANALQIAGTDGTNTLVPYIDPCQRGAKNYTNINQTAGTQLITGAASKKTYICYFWIAPIGTATNIALVEGTGSVCATATISVSGVGGGSGTAATGPNLAANEGFVQGGGGFAAGQATVTADNVCLLQSAANQLSGGIVWVQF